jgi:murein DD-endopeptidase MepM/ murein hydrolase activator NlpD
MKRRLYAVLLLFSFFILPALACNFPTATPNPILQGGISGEALRETLDAGSFEDQTQPTVQPEAQPTQTPIPTITPTAVTPIVTLPPVTSDPGATYEYYARSGDTLTGVANRFGVSPEEISSEQPVGTDGYLPYGLKLVIPNVLEDVTPPDYLLPDSELVNSPTTMGFDLEAFVEEAGGFLSTYRETVDGASLSGVEIIQRVANELSVNPRLLLALLEYRSGWVYGEPKDTLSRYYPIGFVIDDRSGLYQEITIAATQLNKAYYGWRKGTFTEINHPNNVSARLNPQLNPGSAAIQHLLAMFYRQDDWSFELYEGNGFIAQYETMFGDYWPRADAIRPMIQADIEQPTLELPFLPGENWSFTSGPHESWNSGTPRGAVDLSPVTGEPVCAVSSAWVTAMAPGIVARSAFDSLTLDLDGDGNEGTGWVLVYFHLADHERVEAGTEVKLDDPLGHPSCEGGRATGKHVHVARKFNGEWLPADGPVPFVMSGWAVQASPLNYQGWMVKGDQVVTASPDGSHISAIVR